MHFDIGDYVTRESHHNDTIFKIVDIREDLAILKGVNIRLLADSDLSDLNKLDKKIEIDDTNVIDRISNSNSLDRNEYFYLPGKILHIDGDNDYLERCMNFYKKLNVLAYGVRLDEENVSDELDRYLRDLKPDIVVITGHDAYYKKKGDIKSLNSYKNSKNFIKAINIAREYEKSPDKLILIVGACQSNYEELIKAGANFASSPKRVNIHALDPAIIATSTALSDKSKPIDLISIIDKTKYGSEGVGGIITNGTMYVGYPR